jgi:RluA family pseudouridine synthase
MTQKKWRVTEDDRGCRLPDFLAHHLQLPSKKQARRLIDQGQCSINGKAARFASASLSVGDVVEVIEQLPAYKPRILYEDAVLVAIDKPPGLTVTEDEILSSLHLSSCFLVHRLDKHTSGILLVAKDETTQQAMEELFKSRLVKKQYLAVVDGKILQKGTISLPLELKKKTASQVTWGVAAHGRGKPAETQFVSVASSASASLVLLLPMTGRTHQLRIHMAAIKHPILGDHQYGTFRSSTLSLPHHVLHAWKIQFPHPVTKKLVSITAPIPPHIEVVATELFGKDILEKVALFVDSCE